MTKFIGRQYSIGLAKETTRGTYVAATFWLPKQALTVDDAIQFAVDDSSIGIIEDAITQDVTGAGVDISVEGRCYVTSFGMLCLAAMGSETSTVVGGETLVYDHVFSVLESAQHPVFSVSAADANSSGGSGLRYTLCGMDTLDINFEIDKYLTYKSTFMGAANVAGAVTPAFVAEEGFRPQDITIKIAANLAGLAGATATVVKKGTVSIKKNLEEDYVIGSLVAADRLNKEYSIEGSLELFYQDRVLIDTDMIANLAQAMSITATNNDITIGSTSKYQFIISLAKVKFQSIAKKIDNGSIVSETVKFKAYYSIADTQMCKLTLRNLRSTVYA